MMARSTAIVPPETAMRFKFLNVKGVSPFFHLGDVVRPVAIIWRHRDTGQH